MGYRGGRDWDTEEARNERLHGQDLDGKEIQPSVTTVIGPRAMIIITNLYHDSLLFVVPLYTSTQHLIQGQPTIGINGYCILSKIQHL